MKEIFFKDFEENEIYDANDFNNYFLYFINDYGEEQKRKQEIYFKGKKDDIAGYNDRLSLGLARSDRQTESEISSSLSEIGTQSLARRESVIALNDEIPKEYAKATIYNTTVPPFYNLYLNGRLVKADQEIINKIFQPASVGANVKCIVPPPNQVVIVKMTKD